MQEPLNERPHLQNRRDDWEEATDAEVLDALLNRPPYGHDPLFFNWIRNHRPHCLRRSLLLHEQMGGYLGAPALRFLGRKR